MRRKNVDIENSCVQDWGWATSFFFQKSLLTLYYYDGYKIMIVSGFFMVIALGHFTFNFN